jgi:hypothetical protein
MGKKEPKEEERGWTLLSKKEFYLKMDSNLNSCKISIKQQV